jgi:[acyl-carrier-protein] S-malonyltransferase
MPKIAYLFPGQGAQALGMGKPLYDSVPSVRPLFAEAADVLGYDLLSVCKNGPVETLNSTVVSQPAIFVCSLAALESLRASAANPETDCVAAAGLSLGEYTALVFAGAMTFSEGLKLVKQRGEAMQAAADATPSGMVSVLGLEQDKVEELCSRARSKGLMQIANLLCPSNIVVSGTLAACEEVERLAPEMEAMKTIRLAVAGAFHTDLMKPADQVLARALEPVRLQAPKIPVWSNVDARPRTDAEEIRQILVRQVVSPVLWEATIRGVIDCGGEEFFEIGPGRVLAGLLKRIIRKIKCTNIAA